MHYGHGAVFASHQSRHALPPPSQLATLSFTTGSLGGAAVAPID